jgi:hypothetical protein
LRAVTLSPPVSCFRTEVSSSSAFGNSESVGSAYHGGP